MLDYYNAVSDKLVVCNQLSGCVIQVFSKDHQLKYSSVQKPASIDVALKNAIFHQTEYVTANSNFVLFPEEITNKKEVFELSYPNSGVIKEENVEVAHVMFEQHLIDLTSQLVNANSYSDIGIFIKYVLDSKKPNGLYFYEAEGELSLVVVKEGRLWLANRYDVTNKDELFYFIMLAVEQSEIDASTMYVECVSTKGVHEEYMVLFKNYLPAINLAQACQDSSISNEQTLAYFLATCVL